MRNADLLLKVVLAGLVLSTLGAITSSAQTLQTLVNFNGANGSNPNSIGPIAVNGYVYGTTVSASVFQLTPSGSFSTLYSFSNLALPNGIGVILGSDGNLYGTDSESGANMDAGTVFQLTPTGSFTVVYNFCSLPNCADGSNPQAPLLQGRDGNFYGTTASGGTSDGGTVFKLTPSGNLTTLYSFCSLPICADGAGPTVMVQGRDGNLYGLTATGGTHNNSGTVFQIMVDGDFRKLYDFCSLDNCADGFNPTTLLQGSDGNFYGTTIGSGTKGLPGGTIFEVTSSGTLTTLYSFCSLSNCADGGGPQGLVQGSDGKFYGTTSDGGAYHRSSCTPGGCGTFFQFTPGGSLNTLYNFCSQWGCTDGERPIALVQTSNSTFWGTTWFGGSGCATSCGTIWSWSPNVALAPTFTPAFLNFGNQAVNTTSQAKSVYIKNVNTGSATLDFGNLTVNPPFAISSNACGTTLAAGHTCHVSITFTPTVLGTVNGTLSVADNAPGSPQTVPLSGTGVAQATLIPASLAFGNVKVGTTSVAKKVTLKNNLPTTLTGISYSTAPPFAVSASTCGTTLASKGSCTISVTFSPTTIGPASGTLSVSDSANNSPQTVSLSGTGD